MKLSGGGWRSGSTSPFPALWSARSSCTSTSRSPLPLAASILQLLVLYRAQVVLETVHVTFQEGSQELMQIWPSFVIDRVESAALLLILCIIHCHQTRLGYRPGAESGAHACLSRRSALPLTVLTCRNATGREFGSALLGALWSRLSSILPYKTDIVAVLNS